MVYTKGQSVLYQCDDSGVCKPSLMQTTPRSCSYPTSPPSAFELGKEAILATEEEGGQLMTRAIILL